MSILSLMPLSPSLLQIDADMSLRVWGWGSVGRCPVTARMPIAYNHDTPLGINNLAQGQATSICGRDIGARWDVHDLYLTLKITSSNMRRRNGNSQATPLSLAPLLITVSIHDVLCA